MAGITSLLNMGQLSLLANQTAIQTTGNNIANVNTVGYSRQAVRFEEYPALDGFPGQIGNGAYAAEVYRYFNGFVEKSYLDKASQQSRWDAQYEMLQSVESLFNESTTPGINSAMSQFFADWQALSQRPDDKASRDALLSHSDNMVKLLQNAESNLRVMQQQMDQYLKQEVDEANSLIKQIAELNRQIEMHDEPGKNNANTLIDNRNLLVRELSQKLDVDVVDNGSGRFTVVTKAGHTLVDGVNAFSLDYQGPQSQQSLVPGSDFDGEIHFDGSDEYEYTLDVVQSGAVASGAGAAMFRVSLDGGKTWLKDENGNDRLFAARPEDQKVKVQGLDIYFSGATQDLEAGDRFTVTPKSGVYWVTPTTSPLNISPQTMADGTDNPRRITGGTIGGFMIFRDTQVGRYVDRVNALSESLIWEVNRLHSQGAGLENMSVMSGTYGVSDPSIALGSDSSGLAWLDKLEAGNFSMYVYDAASGTYLSNASGPLDFDTATPGIQNFDPAVHSLNDVRDALNNTFGTYVTADIVDNKLVVRSNDGYEFGVGADSAGLLAALGLNTYFQGSDASTIAVRPDVRSDTNFINAGKVNGGNEANEGDNDTATAIAGLATKEVTIATTFERASSQTLSEYYSAIVATVGADTASTKFNAAYTATLAKDLDERQSASAGVNLDEEMASLVKFQHAYKAAAKLVTTADQMMQTLLGLKQ